MPYVPFLHLTSDRPQALYSSAGLPQLSRVRHRVVPLLSAEQSLRTKAAPITLHAEHLPLDRLIMVLTVHGHLASTYTRMVLLVLKETNTPYEFVVVKVQSTCSVPCYRV
jgi:hypothetical protein